MCYRIAITLLLFYHFSFAQSGENGLYCPENLEIAVVEGALSAVVHYPDATVQSDCPYGTPSVLADGGNIPSGGAFPLGSTTLTYHGWDGCGAFPSCSFTITVQEGETSGCEPAVGTACDDGDACTANDTYDANCNCIGTMEDTDADGICDAIDNCPNIANPDQTDTNNDGIGDTCEATGTIGLVCPDNIVVNVAAGATSSNISYPDATINSDCAWGTATVLADGGNLPSGSAFLLGTTTLTFHGWDGCQSFPSCSFTVTLEEGATTGCAPPEGSACDDDNPCTMNDMIDANCNCTGTFQDSDNDGICDATDNCPDTANPDQLDENANGVGDLCENGCAFEAGTACDDGDPCTINDEYDANCNCIGSISDTDGDGICDVEDNCPDMANPDQTDADNNGIGDACDSPLENGLLCPADMLIQVAEGSTSAIVEYPEATAVSDCQWGVPVVLLKAGPESGTSFPLGITTITFQGWDGCGFFEDCSFTISVEEGPACEFPVGSPCDDGNDCTQNDVIKANCDCQGQMTDTDLDGICDSADNCPLSPNPAQQDSDGDGMGNACDSCQGLAGEDKTICFGESIQIGCSSLDGYEEYCFKWLPEEGIEDGQELLSMPWVQPEHTTTYVIYILDDAGNLIATDEALVTVHSELEVTISPETTVICDGQEAILESSSGYVTYLWSTGDTTQDLSVTVAGEYSLTVTDENGCAASTTATVRNFSSDPTAMEAYLSDLGFYAFPVPIKVEGDEAALREEPINRSMLEPCVDSTCTSNSGTCVEDYANYSISINNEVIDHLENIVKQNADYFSNTFNYLNPRVFITSDNGVCACDNFLDSVYQRFLAAELGFWIHVTDNPDPEEDKLYILANVPSTQDFWPNTDDHRQELNEIALKALAEELNAAEGFNSRAERAIFSMLFNLLDNKVTYFMPAGHLQEYRPCGGTTEEVICISPAGIPNTMPYPSTLRFTVNPNLRGPQPADGVLTGFVLNGSKYAGRISTYTEEDSSIFRGYYPEIGTNVYQFSGDGNYTEEELQNVLYGYVRGGDEDGNCREVTLRKDAFVNTNPWNSTGEGPLEGQATFNSHLPLVSDYDQLVGTYYIQCTPISYEQIGQEVWTEYRYTDGETYWMLKLRMPNGSQVEDITVLMTLQADGSFSYAKYNCNSGQWELFDFPEQPAYDIVGGLFQIAAYELQFITLGVQIGITILFPPVGIALDATFAVYYYLNDKPAAALLSLVSAGLGFTLIRQAGKLKVKHVASTSDEVIDATGLITRLKTGETLAYRPQEIESILTKCTELGLADDVSERLINFLFDPANRHLWEAFVANPNLIKGWNILKDRFYARHLGAIELFSDPAVIQAYIQVQNIITSLFPHFPIEELAAIYHYTNSGYSALNAALRSGNPNAYFRAFEELLNSALARLPVYTGKVYRGTKLEIGLLMDKYLSVSGQGIPVTELQFTSTSKNLSVADYFPNLSSDPVSATLNPNTPNLKVKVLFHFEPGHSGKGIENLSFFGPNGQAGNEFEVLIKSKTNFEVTHYKTDRFDSDGNVIVDVFMKEV